MSLEIKITTGGSDYYLSDEAHSGPKFGSDSGSTYYFGFIAVSPVLKLAATTGGYISVAAGTISLFNKVYDSNFPFSGANFSTLLSNAGTATNLPTISIKDSTKYAIFDGSLVLQSLSDSLIVFTVQSADFNVFLAEGTIADSSGDTVTVPWPYGTIANVPGLVCTDKATGQNKFANGTADHPGFYHSQTVSSYFIHLSSAGTTLYTSQSSGSPQTSWRVTDTLLEPQHFTNASPEHSTGTIAVGLAKSANITGTGPASGYVGGLFDYIAADLGATVDSTKGGDVLSEECAIWQRTKIASVELLSQAARSMNMQFYIAPNQSTGVSTIYVIDRATSPTATALNDQDIVSSSFQVQAPLQSVTLSLRDYGWKGEILVEEPFDLVSNNLSFGRQLKYRNFFGVTKSSAGTVATADAIRDIEKKPLASCTVNGIQMTYAPGDRFTFNRGVDRVSVDLIVRSIQWNWTDRTTTISGECTLSPFENE